MLKNKSSVLTIVALALIGLSACEKEAECVAVDAPYVVPDTDYDKLSHPLPRCEPKKLVEKLEEQKPEQHDPEDPTPTPVQPPQPDSYGELGQTINPRGIGG